MHEKFKFRFARILAPRFFLSSFLPFSPSSDPARRDGQSSQVKSSHTASIDRKHASGASRAQTVTSCSEIRTKFSFKKTEEPGRSDCHALRRIFPCLFIARARARSRSPLRVLCLCIAQGLGPVPVLVFSTTINPKLPPRPSFPTFSPFSCSERRVFCYFVVSGRNSFFCILSASNESIVRL